MSSRRLDFSNRYGYDKSIERHGKISGFMWQGTRYWEVNMEIKMAGIDHETFSLEERELFSWTKKETADILQQLKAYNKNGACILLITCNRTELYLSGSGWNGTAYEVLCDILEKMDTQKQFFLKKLKEKAVCRKNMDAVCHLLQVAAGMRSRIFGEDQILTQVRAALTLARDAHTTDGELERLFQIAITAGKRVRTKVRLSAVNTSVVEQMLLRLKAKTDSLKNWNALVIGNGEIGRLAASRLIECGANVTMTVRHYKTREVTIPVGCKIIDYRERYMFVNQMDLIVSATTSPHHTLLWENGLDQNGKQQLFTDGKTRILFDMAVPRDVSPRFGDLPNITLYNIDSLGGSVACENQKEAIEEAMHILQEYAEEYEAWSQFRSYVPAIQEIGAYCAEDIFKRVEKPLKRVVVDQTVREELEQVIETAAKKVVGNLMYDMKEQLQMKEWEKYMEMIQRVMHAREK